MGRAVPRKQHLGRTIRTRFVPSRVTLATTSTRRSRMGSISNQNVVPLSTPRPTQGTTRQRTRRHRNRPLDPRRRVAHALQTRTIQRTRPRLLHHSTQSADRNETSPETTSSTRRERHRATRRIKPNQTFDNLAHSSGLRPDLHLTRQILVTTYPITPQRRPSG